MQRIQSCDKLKVKFKDLNGYSLACLRRRKIKEGLGYHGMQSGHRHEGNKTTLYFSKVL